MVYVELEPELDACVQTQAKRQYNQLLSELLKQEETGELAERLELLRLFLESTNFNQLRNEYERHLLEGKRVRFILFLEEGKSKYKIDITH